MTSVIQPNSMTDIAPSSPFIPVILPIPSKSADNTTTPIQPEKSMSFTGKIPASTEITNYYIKKLMEKQQQQMVDSSYKEQLVCSTEEEKELIETIDTLKTRYKLLTTLDFKNRRLVWQALCQSHPQDEHVTFFNNSTIEINPDITLESDITEHRDSILRIASLYSTLHTYYPGMSYIIQPLVSQMPENEAYSVFVRLLELHDIPTCIYQHMDDRLHDIDIMVKHTCPDVASWLSGSCISADLLDIIFLEGYTETMTRYIVATLQSNNGFPPARAALQVKLPSKRRKPMNTVPLLQQQIEDLLHAMSQLEKEHEAVTKENMQLKIKEMNDEQTQTKLIKRNAVLEKRLKKYKTKLATATSTATMTTTEVVPKQQQQNFCDSLRETGDFGALIASALEPQEKVQDNNDALQNVTSELVAVKLAQFETQQKYEQLEAYCQDLEERVKQEQGLHEQALQKSIYLQNELEDMQMERDQLINEQEEVVEMAMVAKKTSTELQVEKLQLTKQVERLELQVKELEQEKQNYFLPRDTFSEEVFAAHSILFGAAKPNTSKSLVVQEEQQVNEYKTKYVESELRCRELEKYLAETKVKLAELESSCMATPRTSYQPSSRRASMIQYKRSSTASLFRPSTDSFASSTTSLTSLSTSNRSSALYSRIWNAFGKPVCDEPQIIQQPQ